jgi:hypothetical protein
VPEGWSGDVHPLETERIIGALARRKVKAVIVGGIAAILHGWAGSTADADFVPAPDTENLNRLGRALRDLNALVWADPSRKDLLATGKPPEADDFGYTAEGLRKHRVWHLTSDAGPIDITFSIDGVGGHARLLRKARHMKVFGVGIEVAALEDIIESKRAVARPKDLRALPELEALLEEEE